MDEQDIVVDEGRAEKAIVDEMTHVLRRLLAAEKIILQFAGIDREQYAMLGNYAFLRVHLAARDYVRKEMLHVLGVKKLVESWE